MIFSFTAIFSWYERENDGSVLGIIVVLPFLVFLLLAFDTVMTWDGAGGRKRMRVYRSIVIWKIHGAEGLRSILSSFVWNCKPILMLATCDTWQFSHTSFFSFLPPKKIQKRAKGPATPTRINFFAPKVCPSDNTNFVSAVCKRDTYT